MKLINNDCIAAMKEMPDNSVDSIVTDPPYELGFMSKSWDASGIAFNIEVWQEALRVLKPGGHLIAFSGSRTYHRMAVAIEDAGFEIRDQIQWIYGSGFPKSHNLKGDWQGWGTALKPAHEPMVLARKPIVGIVANNVLTYGVGALNIDGSRVEGKLEGDPNRFAKTDGGSFNTSLALENHDAPVVRQEGRWPANVIHDGSDEVLALFPESKGMQTQRSGKNVKVYTGNSLLHSKTEFPEIRLGHNDSGSAARFFYCAKASKKDRNEGLDGFEEKQPVDGADKWTETDRRRGEGVTRQPSANHHPTVKPTDLMRYLCRLITPSAGIVLDPFMGSGSTGKAAILEGFDFIGIDQSAEYVEIAKARIEWAANAK
jgi:site-specific DNA-methyltransferase (adenine-specific)